MKIFTAAVVTIVSAYGLLGATPQKLDGIAAIVGDEVILISEFEAYVAMQMEQLQAQGTPVDLEKVRTDLLDNLIDNKVLLTNAKRDSALAVSSDEVEEALNNHIATILQQNRMTLEQLEQEIYNQQGIGFTRFRAEMREAIRDQLIQQRIQQRIYHSINVTRRDVEQFFTTYQDSLPPLGESVRLSKITKSVAPSQAREQTVFTTIYEIRRRLDQGEDFEALAKELSQGPQAASGGNLGFISKGTISERAFEETAFSLPQGKISQPFKTSLGYHIIQVLEKTDRGVRIRQIFLPLVPDEEVVVKVNEKLNALRETIGSTEEFAQAAKEHSTDRVSRSRGGKLGWSTLSNLSSSIRTAITNLEDGEISEPVRENNDISIYRIDEKSDSRRFNFEDDYSILVRQYREYKANQKLIEKVESWRQNTFIDIRI